MHLPIHLRNLKNTVTFLYDMIRNICSVLKSWWKLA